MVTLCFWLLCRGKRRLPAFQARIWGEYSRSSPSFPSFPAAALCRSCSTLQDCTAQTLVYFSSSSFPSFLSPFPALIHVTGSCLDCTDSCMSNTFEHIKASSVHCLLQFYLPRLPFSSLFFLFASFSLCSVSEDTCFFPLLKLFFYHVYIEQ